MLVGIDRLIEKHWRDQGDELNLIKTVFVTKLLLYERNLERGEVVTRRWQDILNNCPYFEGSQFRFELTTNTRDSG